MPDCSQTRQPYKNHSRTGKAVLHIRHPRNRPLRSGSKLRKQHRPEHTLDAFGVQKSHTTPCHPQGDGMVERFNRSLLQLLRTYVEKQEDWEQHLPLVLYVYRTTTHTSTGMSLFQLMYGRHPQPNTFTPSRGYEATSYQAVLQAKMAELQDLVEAHIVESAHRQKVDDDRHSAERPFKPGGPGVAVGTLSRQVGSTDGRGTGQ